MIQRSGKPSSAELHRLYLHEAGHAVAARLLHRRFLWVRVNGQRGFGLLRCAQHPRLDIRSASNRARTRRYIEREVVIAWCGLVAEEMGTGQRRLVGLEGDAEMIDALLRRIERDKPRRTEIGRQLLQDAVAIMDRAWPAVLAVTEALRRETKLSASRVRAIVSSAKFEDRRSGA